MLDSAFHYKPGVYLESTISRHLRKKRYRALHRITFECFNSAHNCTYEMKRFTKKVPHLKRGAARERDLDPDQESSAGRAGPISAVTISRAERGSSKRRPGRCYSHAGLKWAARAAAMGYIANNLTPSGDADQYAWPGGAGRGAV